MIHRNSPRWCGTTWAQPETGRVRGAQRFGTGPRSWGQAGGQAWSAAGPSCSPHRVQVPSSRPTRACETFPSYHPFAGPCGCCRRHGHREGGPGHSVPPCPAALHPLSFHRFVGAKSRRCSDAAFIEMISMPSRWLILHLLELLSQHLPRLVPLALPQPPPAGVGHRAHPACHHEHLPYGGFVSTSINLILNIPSECLSTISLRILLYLLINLSDRRYLTNIHPNTFLLIILQYPSFMSLCHLARKPYQSHFHSWCSSGLTELLDKSSCCLQCARSQLFWQMQNFGGAQHHTFWVPQQVSSDPTTTVVPEGTPWAVLPQGEPQRCCFSCWLQSWAVRSWVALELCPAVDEAPGALKPAGEGLSWGCSLLQHRLFPLP